MRSICTTIVITAAGLLLFSQFAQASDVEAELRQMQERIADLENRTRPSSLKKNREVRFRRCLKTPTSADG